MRTLFTVKDVRNLQVCVLCQEIGVHQPQHTALAVPVVVCIHSSETERCTVSARARSYCHPRCYIKQMGLAKLLTLHADELGSIRLNDDVPSRVIKRIVAELARRQREA